MSRKLRFGIFGGSFNPPHVGHLKVAESVQLKAGLDLIFFVPNSESPLKPLLEGPSPQDRLKMTEIAVADWDKSFVVDDLEVRRQGKSYTLETVREFKNKYPEVELHLILGVDNFLELEKWKRPEKILEEVNLIVISRSGHFFPPDRDSWPLFLNPLIAEEDFNFLELKSGKSIQFLRVPDVPVSSTEVRKKIRQKISCDQDLTLGVERFIKEQQFYLTSKTKIGNFYDFTQFCFQALGQKKVLIPKVFDLTQTAAITDYAIVASGTSTKHTSSLAEHLIREVKQEFGVFPISCEGLSEGRWVVIDYGGLLVHLFYDYVRQEYSIEKLWKDSKELSWS